MQEEAESQLAQENKVLRNEVLRLGQIIRLLQRDKFGSTSEKLTELGPDQLLFNELELEAKRVEPEQTELIEGYKRKKGRGVRKPFPDNLPREEIVIDLPESESTSSTFPTFSN